MHRQGRGAVLTCDELAETAAQEEGDVETHAELSTFGSWQVPYFCLTLAEKAAEVAPKQASHTLCILAFLPPAKHHDRDVQGIADAHH